MSHVVHAAPVAVALFTAQACRGGDRDEQTAPISTQGSASAANTGGESVTVGSGDPPSATTGVSVGETGSSGASNPPRFDIGVMPDINTDEGCRAVDFLFVIDNSASMQAVQDNLIANFPTFIAGIESSLEFDDFHVGVTTTDLYLPNPSQCELQGGLVVSTREAVCGPYANGLNFMTSADDLASAFSCAANVGTDGDSSEQPIRSMLRALSPDLTFLGGCNAGFARSDALLVIVIVTDEDDDENEGGTPGDPLTWRSQLLELRDSVEESVVVVSLVYDEAIADCTPVGGGAFAPSLAEFTQSFDDNGFVGCVAHEYEPIFTEAIGVISSACENFSPVG